MSDIKTGETIAGANILIKGTYKGAAADLDGYYSIPDVAPGYYDLECSVLGYTVQIAAGIVITAGETITLDFKMESTVLALGEEVIVIGEAPLLDVDNTSSARTMDSEEIENSMAEDINGLLSQQAGIVIVNNEIHIRGGRADENIYIIDGARVKDPISGQSYGSYISADAIQEMEIITGGFNAEYGEAMSGVVDVKIKEGGDQYSGSMTVKTDRPGFELPQSQNTLNSEFSFGGPEPITGNLRSLGIRIPGNVTFFINGYSYISDTYLPTANQLYPSNPDYDIFAPREENNWSFIGKLAWKFDETSKLTYTFDRSLQVNQGYFQSVMEKNDFYPYEYQLNLDNYNTVTRESQQHTINWKQTLSRRTFYELMAAQLYIGVHSAVQNQEWTEYEERQDNEPIIFYPPDQNGEVEVRFGDGFYETGDNGNYHDHYSNIILLEGKITSQVNDRHQIKGGLEFNYSELQMLDINDPWVDDASSLGRNYDMYRVYPSAGAFYFQDKIEYKGMIANVGLRLDYWFPGEYVDNALNNPSDAVISTPGLLELQQATRDLYLDETFGVFGQRCKAHLSPRLGISHPVTDKDMLFFSYGHFSQRPQKSNYVYAHLKSQSQATYQLFGNPNLNPSVTVAYELGIKHKFTNDLVLEATAFYKDLFDYITAENVSEQNPRYGSHTMYFNRDHARSRGIELKLQQRYSRYFSGRADFTYMIVTGKSSSPNTQLYIEAGLIDEKTLGEEYMSWD
ncbi:MAG: TonB-dependent receptor, partial [FCB group bacterium]|nr:TonB-dependent receptor [FCB group bacterium]